MSIYGIASGAMPALQGTGSKFFLPGSTEFADKLTVGQIIKGQVLRQYEGSRYLVNFDGNERVVDSAVPMKIGELIHGRVVGIGERIELQRIFLQDATGQNTLPKQNAPQDLAGRSGNQGDALNTLLVRYQAQLPPDEQVVLTRAMRTSGDANAMAMAGILLNKLGLTQSPELLNAVYASLIARRTQAESGSSTDRNAVDVQPLMVAMGALGVPNAGMLTQLGDVLRQTLEQGSTGTGDANNNVEAGKPPVLTVSGESDASQADTQQGHGGQAQTMELGQFLLNAQTDGSVAHRMGTIPLLLGNRLIEVEVALFEQRRDAEQKPDARHRHLVFRLNTDTLGQVEISARLSGERARVQVAAQDATTTASLSAQAENLRTALTKNGWLIDEITYETRQDNGHNGVVHAVVEHVIRQGSLNQLV